MSGLIELMLEEAEWIWLVQCVDAHVDLGIKMQVFDHELRLMPPSCLIPFRTMINKSALGVENGKLVLILKVSCEVSVETNSSELYLSPVVESISESGIDTVSFSRGALMK